MLPFTSTDQVLETNEIFQGGHLLQLKTYCFSRVSFFDVTVALPRESKHFSKETHLIKNPCF